jgi:hypothetical protein
MTGIPVGILFVAAGLLIATRAADARSVGRTLIREVPARNALCAGLVAVLLAVAGGCATRRAVGRHSVMMWRQSSGAVGLKRQKAPHARWD